MRARIAGAVGAILFAGTLAWAASPTTPVDVTNVPLFTVTNPGYTTGGGGGGGAVTVADGADVTQGAKADSTCATATGSCSVVALVKYLNTQLTAAVPAGTNLIGKVGIDQTTPGTTNLVAAGQNGTWTVQPGNTANTTPWLFQIRDAAGNARGANVNASNQLSVTVDNTPAVTVSGVSTAANQSTEITALQNLGLAQGSTTAGQVGPLMQASVGSASPTYVNAQTAPLAQDTSGRLRVLATISGNAQVVGAAAHDAAISGNPDRIGGRGISSNYTAVSTGDTTDLVTTLVGALITKPYSIPEGDWNYAAASGGISNTTTAVTIAASAGAGLRNYLTACQLSSDPLGAATEFAIRDGAGGTVLYRTKIGTAGIVNGQSITFPSPLKSTAATLLEVVTLTASITGGVFVNCQGYIAP